MFILLIGLTSWGLKMSSGRTENINKPRKVSWFLWASMLLLVAGLYAPLMTVRQMVVFENSVSVVTGIVQLFHHGDYGLFALILLFSVLFPVFKLTLLAWTWFVMVERGLVESKMLQFVEISGKWSMLDVFVAAVIVVAIKLGSISEVSIHYGIYLFALAITGTMVSSHVVRRFITNRSESRA
jgi:paraquat-inducible protein A